MFGPKFIYLFVAIFSHYIQVIVDQILNLDVSDLNLERIIWLSVVKTSEKGQRRNLQTCPQGKEISLKNNKILKKNERV